MKVINIFESIHRFQNRLPPETVLPLRGNTKDLKERLQSAGLTEEQIKFVLNEE